MDAAAADAAATSASMEDPRDDDPEEYERVRARVRRRVLGTLPASDADAQGVWGPSTRDTNAGETRERSV